jgi:hypothetical protein
MVRPRRIISGPAEPTGICDIGSPVDSTGVQTPDRGARGALSSPQAPLKNRTPKRVRSPIQKPVAPAKWTLISLFPERDFLGVSEISLIR